MTNAPIYSLVEVTEQYLLRKYNDRQKYFARYFSIAGDIYKEIYRTILPTIISKYLEVIDDGSEKYPFIWKPDNMQIFYGISVTDNCGDLKQVFFNDQLNVFSKPAVKKKCGCLTTDLCDCISNLQVVITPKVIDGTTYYTKVWVECCNNGDVLQYTEVPVKSYGTLGGDYSNDYGDDYDIINDGTNVVTLRFTKNLGRLDTKDCGCPLDTENNKDIIFKKCGCFLAAKPVCCRKWYEHNIHCFGEYKFSECGKKILLKNVQTDNGFVIISYRPTPVICGEEIFVQEYARRAIWSGIEFDSTIYFPRATLGDKQFAKNQYRADQFELFMELNPLNRDRFFNEVTAEIKM